MKPGDSLGKPITGLVIVTSGSLTVPGCRVETAYPLEPGQSVQLRMQVDRHPSVRIDVGMVRWATQGEAGIEFISMTEEDQLRLRGYAEAHDRA